MARLTDIIESFIKELVDECNSDELEIQRNELAVQFSCAPSQINYVLTTRFTMEKGYYIESKRGGGGCIRIKKVSCFLEKNIKDVLFEKIGSSITCGAATEVIEVLIKLELLTKKEADILRVTINDRTLACVGNERNKLRADILKSVILSLSI